MLIFETIRKKRLSHRWDRVGQTGRSMVEMLGVLAVVGMLSAVAVQGLKHAFDKNEANTLLQEANMRAVFASTEFMHGKTSVNFDAFKTINSAVFSRETTLRPDGSFHIGISNVKKRVCEQMQNVARIASRIILSFSPVVCSDENEIILAFNKDLSEASITFETEPEPIPSCSQPTVWVSLCDGSESECCPDNGTECVDQTNCCTHDTDCSGNNKICRTSNTCGCPDGYFEDSSGNCYDCSFNENKEATEENCAVCDATPFPRKMSNGRCMRGSGCPVGYFDSQKYCRSCSDPSSYAANETECNKCTERKMSGGYCSLKTCAADSFETKDGLCYACSFVGAPEATSAECDKCDATETPRIFWTSPEGVEKCGRAAAGRFYQYDSYLVERDCSSGGQYRSIEKACRTCDNTSTPRKMVGSNCYPITVEMFENSTGGAVQCSSTNYEVATAENCAACDNTSSPRKMVADRCIPDSAEVFINTSNQVRDCTDGAYQVATPENCAACDGTSSPRKMVAGRCVPKTAEIFEYGSSNYADCSSGAYPLATAENCATCDNTSSPRKMVAGRCVPKTAEIFENSSGNYVNCSETKAIKVATEDNCLACAETANPRKMVGTYCVLPSSGIFLLSSNPNNYKFCSETNGITTSAEYCAACDDSNTPREMVDGRCVLKQ